MRGCCEVATADVRRRMHQLHSKGVAQISEELGIFVMTLYKWMKTWLLQVVLPTSSRWC
jgi:transposase-like protein